MKKKSATKTCATPTCGESINDGVITGLCKRCYSSIYHWTKRDNADVVKRARNLQLYESRINFLLSKSKVKLIRPKQEYIKLAVLPGQVAAYRKRTKYKLVNANVKDYEGTTKKRKIKL